MGLAPETSESRNLLIFSFDLSVEVNPHCIYVYMRNLVYHVDCNHSTHFAGCPPLLTCFGKSIDRESAFTYGFARSY